MTLMKSILKSVSALALIGTIGPPVLYLLGRMDAGPMKWWMVISTVVWFVATPLWMDRS